MERVTNKPKVAVGLSGGVDSSLAAVLLAEKGFDVTGVHLICWEEPGCRAPQDRKDALAVAMQLGIPFEVLDYRKEYSEKVIDYFYNEYKAGRTPNPDVICNREIKFGLFLDWALDQGFDCVATGHYARVAVRGRRKDRRETGAGALDIENLDQGFGRKNLVLLKGKDEKKDQSYFLYTLTQEKLKHILFPLGNLTKREVRKQARKRGLPTADKPDSVGICFVGEVDVQEFLRREIEEKEGEVVIRKARSTKHEARNKFKVKNSNAQSVSDLNVRNSDLRDNYEVIGKHKGVWFYTIGQRHGFKISIKNSAAGSRKFKQGMPPLYVLDKDNDRNRLIVGTKEESYEDHFSIKNTHFINGIEAKEVQEMKDLGVRIRHGGKVVPATPTFKGSTLKGVELSEPQKGIAPGQAAVFYRGEECLGGGTIEREQSN